MAGDSENNLDYGPAPGMGQERLPGGDIREWAEANNPDWVDSPNDLRKNPIYNPNNEPLRVNPQDAYNPIAEGPGLITNDLIPVVLAQGAEGMADIPSQTSVGTVYDFHQKLVLVQGVPFGEATNIVERLYEQGDPEVHRLSGIDEWINGLPSKASRMGKAFSLGMQEFPAAMGKMLSESGMPAMIPPELRGHTTTPEEIALQTEVLAKGKGVEGANLAGDVVPSIAAGIGAARLATKGLLQLPRYAAAKKMLEGSAVRARFGQALTTESMIAGSKNLRNAVIAGDVLGGTAAAVGEVYTRGGSGKDLAITGAASVLGPLAFGLAGKVIFKKLANLRDKPYVEGLSDTIDWLSRKSGVSQTELHSRINSFDNLAEQLVITGAPDVVLQKFYHGIPSRVWETELGTHFGMWHALEAKTAPDALDKILRNIPMIGRGAAKRAYHKAHEAIQINALAEKDAAKALVKQGKRTFSPWKAPITKVQVAIGEGLENGGATTYFPPGSKFAKTASKLGPVPTKQKVLVRATVVDFDPNTETLAEATLRTLKGRSDLVRVSNYILNKYPFHGPKEYADISNEFAYRTAKKLGYESIQGQATTGMRDNLYVDLLNYKPVGGVAAIVDEIEAKIKKSYLDKFEGIPSIILPAVGAGAVMFGMTPESEAIDFSKLRKIASSLNKYTHLPASPDEFMAKLSDIEYSKYGAKDPDFMPNISGISGGFGYAAGINKKLNTATEILDKMEEVNNIVRTSPEKLDLIPMWNNFIEGDKLFARFIHPDVKNNTILGRNVNEVGSIESLIDPVTRELHGSNLMGYGPEVYGVGGLRQLMRLGKKLNLDISGWMDSHRISGVRSKQGGFSRTLSVGKFKAFPIVVGLAGVGLAGQGQAAVLPPKKLQPIVDKITEKIYQSKGIDSINPLESFMEEVEAQSPPTGRMLWGLYEKQAETGYTSKDKLLVDYAQVYKDLREDSPNIVAAATDTMPGRVNYELGHPLSARSISSIGGYVDPADGKWFLDVVGAKRAGIGQKVLQKVVSNAKSGGLIKGVKGKYSKLAMIAAATAASVAYDWIAPQESLAMPWGKLMGKGIKGVADDVAAGMAGANSPEELLTAMRAARRAVVDSTNSEAFTTKAEALFAAGDINPDKALGDEFKKVLGSERLSSIASAGRPVAAIDDQFYDMYFTQMVSKRDAMLTSSNSVSHLSVKKADEILTKVDLKLEEYDEFDAAIHGLRQSSDGSLVQSVKGISSRIDGAAREVREILDHLWQLKTGIHAKAPAIIKEFGLEESEDTWRMLQYIQGQDLANPAGPLVWKGRNVVPSEVAAAVQTKGLINPQPWQNMDTKFVDGYFTQMPIKGERVKLLDEHRRILEMYPNGKMPTDVKASYTSIQDRLVVLADLEAGLARRRKISLLSTPKQHYYGPINEAEELDLPGISKEKDPKRILGSYIHGLHSSIYFDEQLYLSKGLTTYLAGEGDYPAAEFVRTMLNTYRGIRSVNEDSKVAYVFNSLRRKGQKYHLLGIDDPFTVQRVRNIASKVMEWQYMTKLAMQIRFPITNATQTALTTAPAVGWSNVMAATAKVMGNPKAAYAEAAAQHILRAESMFTEELEHTYKGKLITALDWLPSMSENFNRVVAYHAGKEQALKAIAKSGKFKPPGYIRYIDQDVLQNGTDKEIAEMYGKAVMYTTQFPTGPQGRPLMWSGGAIRRVAGQFKSFQVGYLGLLKDMLKHSKTGDAMPILSAVTSLFMLGGVTAVAGSAAAPMIIDWLRMSAAKLGLDPDIIPEGTPIGAALEMLGANPGIDISGSIQPGVPIFGVNPITETNQAMNFALGPTFGGALSVLGSAAGVMAGDKTGTDLATNMARQVLPLAVTGAEALQEAGIGTEFFDALNYRGGIYTESGESFVEDRPVSTIIKRGLNLQPSARSKQYDYVRQIERAMAADEPEKVMDLVDRARMEGLVISDKILSGLKGQAKRKENKLKPNQPR